MCVCVRVCVYVCMHEPQPVLTSLFTVKQCGVPVDIPNGNVTFSDVIYESVANYTCDRLYETADSLSFVTTVCAENKTWSPPAPVCCKSTVLPSLSLSFHTLFQAFFLRSLCLSVHTFSQTVVLLLSVCPHILSNCRPPSLCLSTHSLKLSLIHLSEPT